MTNEQLCQFGLEVIEIEARAVQALSSRIDIQFAQACQLLLSCEGRIIVTGMGKSGHIARKIASTLASTGSPAFFVHPGEANHGDMGMIARKDIVLALSHSGETAELLTMLPVIKRLGISLICLSGNRQSTLAKAATIVFDTQVAEEACPLGLAPTSSTTVALVMGDALAITLLRARGFTSEDFALYHPGGSLGRRLLLHIDTIMRTGNKIPTVAETAGLDQALIEMTQKSLGMTNVVDHQQKLVGIYTDGDLRRNLSQGIDIHQAKIKDLMTVNAITVQGNPLAAEAMRIMETHKITSLTVVAADQTILGVVHMHDLLTAGIV